MAMPKQSKSYLNLAKNYYLCKSYRIVGFDDLGSTDSFQTAALELKLLHAGVIKKKEDNTQTVKKSIFQSNDTDSELED